MAIHYYSEYSTKHNQRNFGDDINPFLLEHFLPKKLIKSETECVVGIGTILNNKLINRVKDFEHVHVFTSGVGYGDFNQLIDISKFSFHAVRGPKTAKALEIPSEKAITDGVILLSELYGKTKKRHTYTFIPHVNTHWMAGDILESTCEQLGINYLVPNVDLFYFIDVVSSSEFVICEAMHGAILADTLRIPWSPVKIHHALEFKWEDWCQSMDLPYKPTKLLKVYNSKDDFLSNLRRQIKKTLIKRQLKSIQNNEFVLSQQNLFEKKVGSLLTLIDKL